jgi:hypothetical protein
MPFSLLPEHRAWKAQGRLGTAVSISWDNTHHRPNHNRQAAGSSCRAQAGEQLSSCSWQETAALQLAQHERAMQLGQQQSALQLTLSMKTKHCCCWSLSRPMTSSSRADRLGVRFSFSGATPAKCTHTYTHSFQVATPIPSTCVITLCCCARYPWHSQRLHHMQQVTWTSQSVIEPQPSFAGPARLISLQGFADTICYGMHRAAVSAGTTPLQPQPLLQLLCGGQCCSMALFSI